MSESAMKDHESIFDYLLLLSSLWLLQQSKKKKLLKNGISKLHCQFATHVRTVFFKIRMLRLYICSFLFYYKV